METVETMAPGRHGFDGSGLKGHAMAILRAVVREQYCQREYLEHRSEIETTQAWKRATSTARVQFYEFLRGAIEMLFVTAQIGWFHRVNGVWVASTCRDLGPGPNTDRTPIDYAKLDPNGSRFLWVDSKKEWFETK